MSTTTKSTCPYCGVGCGVLIDSAGGRITAVRGDPDHPANQGRLCTKGSTLHLTMRRGAQAHRLLYPEIRLQRAAERERRSWTDTVAFLATRYSELIALHGPDSVGFYISGQLLTEDYYVFNKLAKGLIGTNNVDTNSRLCMSSAVAGYKQTLGADAPPASYEDVELADCLFIAGSNTAWAHPVLFRRIEAAKARRPEMKIVVVDPRRTDTARQADLHLAIQPGTDVALFHGMLHLMLWEDLVRPDYIAAYTEGFADLKQVVREMTPRLTAEICGIDEAALTTAARWFATSPATLSLYCQGLNQSSSGTAKNAALINLHLATGQIGRPGAGPFSLTGQPNAMGGREVGGLANLLSAHRDLANPAHRAEVAALWGVPDVPAKPGKTAVEMFEAAADGEIKALWIACTNPAQSLPNQAAVRAALERAELVVVQEAYADTETTAYADVLLPATSWGERDGTVTNSERRISRVRPALSPPGEAQADWQIATTFARALEQHLRPGQTSLFPYASPEAVWLEHRESTRGRDLDITGLSYAMLEADGPQQWPLPTGAVSGKVRLYEDGVFPTASGKAKFFAEPYRRVAEPIDARYPIALSTGRLRDQWHGMSRTGTVAQLFGHTAEPALEMHTTALTRLGLKTGDLALVRSRRGELVVPVMANDDIALGQAWLPMHWGGRTLLGNRGLGINALTQPKFDPYSKQPELKHAAIRVEPAKLPWRLTAFGYAPTQQLEERRQALAEVLSTALSEHDFASCVLIGREPAEDSGGEPGTPQSDTGLQLRIACTHPLPPAVIARIDALFGLDGSSALRYEDRRRGIGRCITLAEDRPAAIRLSGSAEDVLAEVWLKSLLLEHADIRQHGSRVLLPGTAPPTGAAVKVDRIICNCNNVSASKLQQFLSTQPSIGETTLQQAQTALGCGTTCGSCVPELRRIVLELATA